MMRTLISRFLYYGLVPLVRSGYLSRQRRLLQQHEWAQWLSPEKVRQRQLDKLCRLLAHATKHVPYYRQNHRNGLLPDRVDSLEEIRQVPLLTKQILMDRIEEFVDDTLGVGKLLPRRSGGSTGEPLKFFISPDGSDAASAAETWGDSLAGYRPGDPAAWIWGSHFHEPPPSLGKQILRYLGNMDVVITDSMEEATLQAAVDHLNKMMPAVIIAYKNSLIELTEYIRRKGIRPAFPRRGVISTAETLPIHQRKLLEEVYGRDRVFNRYGTREAGLVGMECDCHMGMHVSCENVLVDQDPLPELPGLARVVVTKLQEFGLPLIRYDLDDCVTTGVVTCTCTCGRGYPLMGDVQGRLISILRRRDGTAVGGQIFVALLDYQPIRQYRVVQEDDYSVCIQVVPTEEFDDAARNKIVSEAIRLLGHLPVKLELCKSIPGTRSSKLLPIVSKVDARRAMASVRPEELSD